MKSGSKNSTIAALICLVVSLSFCSAEIETRPPNIIVIFADDQGWADLGVQGSVPDVRTPNIDRMAREGVRCTAGYITAPQCSPSRAGLITGRYQQRFGLNHIPECPLPLEEITIAERLKPAGYTSGMVGKWHLNPNALCREWAAKNLPEAKPNKQGRVKIPAEMSLAYYPHRQGFNEFFVGQIHQYYANYDLQGNDLQPDGEWVTEKRYRLEVQTDAALAFLDRNQDKPFFLYLCYFAPHTPLEATQKYLDRFPGDMPERRRYALAMISAMDDGVGRILDRLQQHGIDDRTLVIFTSDNGAPLKLTKPDNPVTTDAGGWDGSLNEPWVGEKGMLTEGGIRVPFVLRWKGTLPQGLTYDHAVSSLDIAATACAMAGLPPAAELDGVNLLPFLTGKKRGRPHDALFWRFWNQTAVRSGKWKYINAGNAAEFLFDLSGDEHERNNLIKAHPDIAKRLAAKAAAWANELTPPGVPMNPLNVQEGPWYQHHVGLNAN